MTAQARHCECASIRVLFDAGRWIHAEGRVTGLPAENRVMVSADGALYPSAGFRAD